ncbi:MAG TPA: lytic transglycosylase domain-containing protein [Bryobacteraceae bacterium]|nr:lytic transglycosylase domain-containing protein [Bryobacteraceae bacterium]
MVCSTVHGQNTNPAALSQGGLSLGTPRAVTQAASEAMQKSLEQQQAALDAFREHAQAAALAEQHESAVKQVEPLEPHTSTVTAIKSLAGPSSPEVSRSKPSEFFTLPWPGSLPLSVPNVQIATDACGALGSSEVSKLVQSAAGKHGLSPDLLRSVMKQESAFKPCALSTAGAMGLMQIMPETADLLHLEDPYDPPSNVDAGAKFLKMMLDRFGGDVTLALAAYNAGPGAVEKAGGVPPINETLQYLANILGDLPVAY